MKWIHFLIEPAGSFGRYVCTFPEKITDNRIVPVDSRNKKWCSFFDSLTPPRDNVIFLFQVIVGGGGIDVDSQSSTIRSTTMRSPSAQANSKGVVLFKVPLNTSSLKRGWTQYLSDEMCIWVSMAFTRSKSIFPPSARGTRSFRGQGSDAMTAATYSLAHKNMC